MAPHFHGALLATSDAQDIPRLGHLVWYDIGPVDQARPDVRQLLADAGIDPKLLPSPSKSKAYHCALKEIRQMGTGDVRVLVRPVYNKLSAIRHAVTVEMVKNDNLEYRCEMFTVFQKDAGNVDFVTDGQSDRDDHWKETIEIAMDRHMNHVTPQEIRNFVGYDMNRMNAVSCRSRGGLWFVPSAHTSRLVKLQTFVESMACGSWMHAHPVLDTGDWRSNVADYVERDFDVEIGSFKADVEAILDDARANGGIVKRKMLETKIKNFNEIQTKAGMYERLLNYRADHIRTEVAEQCEQLEAIVRGEVDEFTATVPYKERKHIEAEERRQAKAKATDDKLNREVKAPF